MLRAVAGLSLVVVLLFSAVGGVLPVQAGCKKQCITTYTDPNGCEVQIHEHYTCDGEYSGSVTITYC